MKQKSHAGMTGKGFYAALALSAAMVGAACRYAYSEAGKLTPPAAPSHQYTGEDTAQTTAVPQVTAPQTTKSTAAPRTAAVTEAPAETVTEAVAEAAAILHRTTETETAPPAPAETEPPVEQPIPPVAGKLLQRFSHGDLVKSPTTGIWSTHNGADYAADYGSDVCCTEDGTVTGVEKDALFGVCVTVLHQNGTVTRYCGLNEGLNVQPGDVIARGTVIGVIGDTNEGESTLESHLHFEVQQNDKYIDPESYLAGACAGDRQPEA
ncbi:MAG: M23 family metallopeptidase [Oscillospiraceae bacterium]|nr:M23 family metallopeptidase [Oscillospiraceae bacterium]